MSALQKVRMNLGNSVDQSIAKRIPDPPGYSPSAAKESAAPAQLSRKDQDVALLKRQDALFSLATSPFKQAAMMAFMMYMAGTQLHFFSIMATINGIYSPFNAIMKSGAMFQPDREGKLNVLIPRLIYCGIHGGALLFALYRIHLMGLLPTHLSDWVSSIRVANPTNRAIPSLF